jgi:glycosyltransferase involved in cell wall biosynthesis
MILYSFIRKNNVVKKPINLFKCDNVGFSMKKPSKILPVSIVMPVYNSEDVLEETMDSILNQTFKDFEFIIINDGSTDSSLNILKKYVKSDKRIRLINNKKNMGFANSLNVGLKAAKGKYIAISNSDDVSHPRRIGIQFDYLEKHPDIFLIGTSAVYIDKNGKEIRRFRKYDDYKILEWRLRKSCGIMHSSTMFRNQEIFFDENFGGATDYHFFYQVLKKGKKLTNIPQFLLRYRVHEGSMSVYNRKQQEYLTGKVIGEFKKLPDGIGLLRKLYYSQKLLLHYIRTFKEKRILNMKSHNK